MGDETDFNSNSYYEEKGPSMAAWHKGTSEEQGKLRRTCRGVYDDADLYAEYLKRTDPAFYKDQLKRGYIRGVRVGRPAVISINTAAAAYAVNELLARLHPFRSLPNSEFAIQKLLFSHGRTARRSDGTPDAELAGWVGRGNCSPLMMCGRLEAAA